MKKIIYLSLILLFSSEFTHARKLMERWEPGNFEYGDTTFWVGQKKIIDILFSYDKVDVMQDSQKSLDTIVLFLKCNPKLKIEISNHTDQRGNDKYNLELSKRRAAMIYDYIVRNGIQKDRLSYVGKGETEPIYDDKEFKKIKGITKEEQERYYAINRRTELEITATDFANPEKAFAFELSGKWNKNSYEILQVLLGRKTYLNKLSNFNAAMIEGSLLKLLKNEATGFENNPKAFFAYQDINCKNSVLVLVSKSKEEDPALFSEWGCRIFKYDLCFKVWTEVGK